jgi:hypothetical protein
MHCKDGRDYKIKTEEVSQTKPKIGKISAGEGYLAEHIQRKIPILHILSSSLFCITIARGN